MPEDKKPITDVEHPGKSAPPETSKPVIVGNRPLLKDPMVVDDDKDTETKQPEHIEPKDDDKPADKPTLSSQSQVKLEPLPDSPKPDADKAKDQGPSLPTEAEAVQQKESDAPKDGAHKKQVDETAAAEARQKHRAAIEKLAESKQYALPIKVPEERRNRRALIIGGIVTVVLVLTWVNIALDAGIISLGGLQPITHFFSN